VTAPRTDPPHHVEVEREITAPADRVWALVSDVQRMGEWSPEAVAGEWRGGANGPAVGARFRGRNQRGWRRWSTSCRVTTSEPGREFAFRVTSVGFGVAEWGYHLRPTDAGCAVVETWDDERGALIRVLGKLVTGVSDRASHNRDSMEQTLAALAAAAEGPSNN
jgi:uncharacterized protein YndB with AHSA1/START domain